MKLLNFLNHRLINEINDALKSAIKMHAEAPAGSLSKDIGGVISGIMKKAEARKKNDGLIEELQRVAIDVILTSSHIPMSNKGQLIIFTDAIDAGWVMKWVTDFFRKSIEKHGNGVLTITREFVTEIASNQDDMRLCEQEGSEYVKAIFLKKTVIIRHFMVLVLDHASLDRDLLKCMNLCIPFLKERNALMDPLRIACSDGFLRLLSIRQFALRKLSEVISQNTLNAALIDRLSAYTHNMAIAEIVNWREQFVSVPESTSNKGLGNEFVMKFKANRMKLARILYQASDETVLHSMREAVNSNENLRNMSKLVELVEAQSPKEFVDEQFKKTNDAQDFVDELAELAEKVNEFQYQFELVQHSEQLDCAPKQEGVVGLLARFTAFILKLWEAIVACFCDVHRAEEHTDTDMDKDLDGVDASCPTHILQDAHIEEEPIYGMITGRVANEVYRAMDRALDAADMPRPMTPGNILQDTHIDEESVCGVMTGQVVEETHSISDSLHAGQGEQCKTVIEVEHVSGPQVMSRDCVLI